MEMYSGFVKHEVDFAPSGGLVPYRFNSLSDYNWDATPMFRKNVWLTRPIDKNGLVLSVASLLIPIADYEYKDAYDRISSYFWYDYGDLVQVRPLYVSTPLTSESETRWEAYQSTGSYQTLIVNLYCTGLFVLEVYFIDPKDEGERVLTRVSIQVDGSYMNGLDFESQRRYPYNVDYGRSIEYNDYLDVVDEGTYDTSGNNPFYGYHGFTRNGVVWAFSDTSYMNANVFFYYVLPEKQASYELRRKALINFNNGVRYFFHTHSTSKALQVSDSISETPPVYTVSKRTRKPRFHLVIGVSSSGTDNPFPLVYSESSSRFPYYITTTHVEYKITAYTNEVKTIPNRIRKAAGQSYIGTYEDGTTIPIMKSNKTFTGVNGAEFQGSMIGDGIATPDGDIYSYMEAGREYVLNE